MNKNEYISYWLEQSEDDWRAVSTLYNGANYLQSLFFAHLVVEKIAKALWIKHNEGNVPPKTHNILYLLSFTTVEIPEERGVFILNLNRFQLEGRYPDYRQKMNSICNRDFTKKMLEETNRLRLWLIEKVQ